MESIAKPASQSAARDGCRPPGEPAAERLLRLVHCTTAASRQLRRRVGEVAATWDLSDAEFLALWLCQGEGRVQVELAGAIGISPAQMSGLVERLRARGLVAMQKQALDRRRQVWRTSAAGEALLDEAAGRLGEVCSAVRDVLRDDEQQALAAWCQRVADAVQPPARRAASSGRTGEQDRQRGSQEAA